MGFCKNLSYICTIIKVLETKFQRRSCKKEKQIIIQCKFSRVQPLVSWVVQLAQICQLTRTQWVMFAAWWRLEATEVPWSSFMCLHYSNAITIPIRQQGTTYRNIFCYEHIIRKIIIMELNCHTSKEKLDDYQCKLTNLSRMFLISRNPLEAIMAFLIQV